MKILIVAATRFEIQPLIDAMEKVCQEQGVLVCKYKKSEINFLVTGIGMVTTAYYIGKILDDTYDGAFNLGICGSYNRNLEIGTVVNVYEDVFSELGAEDGDNFLTLEDLKLEGTAKISNSRFQIPNAVVELIPRVNGITVNTTHGNEQSIDKVFRQFHPMIESMEGAAFMFACEQENIPYAQLRAISNYVEKRNRDNWNIPLAIENLNNRFLEILNCLE